MFYDYNIYIRFKWNLKNFIIEIWGEGSDGAHVWVDYSVEGD